MWSNINILFEVNAATTVLLSYINVKGGGGNVVLGNMCENLPQKMVPVILF